jgi:hypothetical protein
MTAELACYRFGVIPAYDSDGYLRVSCPLKRTKAIPIGVRSRIHAAQSIEKSLVYRALQVA